LQLEATRFPVMASRSSDLSRSGAVITVRDRGERTKATSIGRFVFSDRTLTRTPRILYMT